MVYEIRGQKVMIDFDLARIYGYTTKRFNEQIKNNIEKFPEDFMFQLTKEEVNHLAWSQIATSNEEQILMSKKSTSSGKENLKFKKFISSWGGTRKLPFIYTLQSGISFSWLSVN